MEEDVSLHERALLLYQRVQFISSPNGGQEYLKELSEMQQMTSRNLSIMCSKRTKK